MVQQTSTITLSSLYSSGQCLLSVLGSIGVILLFAGIPQLIYSTPVNPGSLMTFLLGAILICLMVAGNAFIGYKYRQLVRSRRENSRSLNLTSSSSSLREDKPPSYDDLLHEDGLPPDYASIVKKEKPPKYEDLVTEVYNWPTIAKVVQGMHHMPVSPSLSAPTRFPVEMPIVVPIHRNLSQNFEPHQVNLGFQSSGEIKTPNQYSSSQNSLNAIKAKVQRQRRMQRSTNNTAALSTTAETSPSTSPKTPNVQYINENSPRLITYKAHSLNTLYSQCPEVNGDEILSSQL